MSRYIDVDGYRKLFDEEFKKTRKLISEGETHLDNLAEGFFEAGRVIDRIPTADVVEVDEVSEKIIRKKAEVSDYWQKDVKQYRTMQGYSNIEHDVDNFLRGYNEAVEDILAILDGERREVCSSN